VAAVEPSLRLAEIERAQKKPTDNLDAYDLHLRALPAINAYTQDGFVQAAAQGDRARPGLRGCARSPRGMSSPDDDERMGHGQAGEHRRGL
jgi:hypothetical protein